MSPYVKNFPIIALCSISNIEAQHTQMRITVFTALEVNLVVHLAFGIARNKS